MRFRSENDHVVSGERNMKICRFARRIHDLVAPLLLAILLVTAVGCSSSSERNSGRTANQNGQQERPLPVAWERVQVLVLGEPGAEVLETRLYLLPLGSSQQEIIDIYTHNGVASHNGSSAESMGHGLALKDGKLTIELPTGKKFRGVLKDVTVDSVEELESLPLGPLLPRHDKWFPCVFVVRDTWRP